MIKKLKHRLTLLFLCSVMGIFTLVFCLFINENLQAKKEAELNFFTRMTTYLVFQLENTSNIKQDMELYGQSYHLTLLLSHNEQSFVPVTLTSSETDVSTLVEAFEQELSKTSTNSADYIHSSQSGIFTFSTSKEHSFYGIQADIVTQNMDQLTVYVIREATSSLTFLKKQFSFYFTIWVLVFAAILLLSNFLINKALKPTQQTLESQKEFVAAASHELKAPLAVILSSAECIKEEPSLGIKAKQHTEIIDSECLRMSKLVQDLLLLSSADANTWKLNKSDIDVDTLLINTYEKYNSICRQKKIHFHLGTTDELYPPLNGDPDRIEQILSIFMENAINYSPAESELLLDACKQGNMLTFSITDHGTGIAAKDKPFIFHRFFCADKSRTQKEHYGLGLSIAKELVDMHNGKIELSDTPGGGCTFKISFPF